MAGIRRGIAVATLMAGCLVGASTADAADDESAAGVEAGRAGASSAIADGEVELGASLAAATALALGLACVAATRRTQDEPRRERINW